MRLSEVFTVKKTVAVDVGDGKFFNITYQPQMITPETLMKFAALKDIDPKSAAVGLESLGLVIDIQDALREWVLQCVSWWDLTYDDDTPILITPNHIKNVPLSILMLTVSAMKEDASVNPQTGSNSPATSSRMDG